MEANKDKEPCPGCQTGWEGDKKGLVPANGHSWGDGSNLCKLCNGTGEKEPTS